VVDPPLQVPDDGYIMPIKTVPGALIWYRAGQQDKIEPLRTGGDLQLGQEMLTALQQQILRIFHVDWMLLPTDPADPASAGKGVTATFTLHQRDQQMQMMSPMLARQQSEFLGPLIDRDFALKWRQSVRMRFGEGSPFPPPPAILQRKALRVEYISPIAVAQKSSQLDNVMRLVQTQMQLIQADPTTPRVVNGEGILRMTARDLNTPTLALKTPEVLAAEQKAEADAQAQLNGHAQLQSLAQSAKDGSAAVANLAQANSNGQVGQAA
jgi:Bacteriophage head to tail connecting protein